MVRFFSRVAVPHPDDLCLVHAPLPGAPSFRPVPGARGWVAPRHSLAMGHEPGLFLGELDERPLWAIEAPADPDWVPLRTLMAEADPDQTRAAIRAAELAAWRRDHQFCGVCGSPTRRREDQVAFECPRCRAEFWPRVTPAVIMLVHRGDEVLLARNARFRDTPIFSCVAGFVEAGETLEDAVAREVAEEVGVTVGRPEYVGSQAWPFPHALMAGFFAPWVSGEPTPDGVEIVEAGWFRRNNLPPLPFPLSIARRLIRTFYKDENL